MSINDLYTEEKQAEIQESARCSIHETDARGISSSNRRYFRPLAEKHSLISEVRKQAEYLDTEELKPEQLAKLADMVEIANLFLVDRSTVMAYIRENLSERLYRVYQRACFKRGRKKAMDSLTKGGKRHELTRDDRKNGGKGRNHRSN